MKMLSIRIEDEIKYKTSPYPVGYPSPWQSEGQVLRSFHQGEVQLLRLHIIYPPSLASVGRLYLCNHTLLGYRIKRATHIEMMSLILSI
jgi:hypothetical protein